jgi:hypothetical protein
LRTVYLAHSMVNDMEKTQKGTGATDDSSKLPTPLMVRFPGYVEPSNTSPNQSYLTNQGVGVMAAVATSPNQSYLTNQGLGVMSSLAGSKFGRECPEAYHTVPIVDIPEGLFCHAGMPGVLVQLDSIQAAMASIPCASKESGTKRKVSNSPMEDDQDPLGSA